MIDSEKFNEKSATDRRRFLLSAGLAAAGVGTFSNSAKAAGTKGRIAVIGAGMGGLSAAYFLDPEWSVDVFESRSKLGGHCDTVTLPYKGKDLAIDLGAQFCHPDTHPLYLSLLTELGLYRPDDTAHDAMIDAEGSVSIFHTDSHKRIFISKKPLDTFWISINFAAYTQAARAMITKNGSWFTTLGEWIDSLWLAKEFKEDLLMPWLSALIGTTVEKAKTVSARSILQTFALAFPKNVLAGARTYNSAIGLGGNLEYLASQCRQTQFYRDSAVTRLDRVDNFWYLETAKGRFGPYESLVLNLPPHTSKTLLEPYSSELYALLDRFTYFPSKVSIHEDPAYMLPERADWAVYNAGISGGECEGSVWVGALHGQTEGEDALDLFKSWASMRPNEPQKLLAERRFRHPLLTPDAIAAARDLEAWQGQFGVYFSGQFTTGMDLQEGALFSGMQVAKRLSPQSSTYRRFLARLKTEGKDSIDYRLS